MGGPIKLGCQALGFLRQDKVVFRVHETSRCADWHMLDLMMCPEKKLDSGVFVWPGGPFAWISLMVASPCTEDEGAEGVAVVGPTYKTEK